MAMAKYDHSLVYDQAMGRGLPGQTVQVVHPDTGIPVDEVLDLDGTPIQALVSNSQGYVQPFQIEDGPPLVRVRVGRISYDLVDLTMIGEASLAAQQAAQAAVDAANLVGAPADTVVKTLVDGSTQTQSALNAKYAGKDTATR
ncbi:hypothetical protein [Glutamicibacter creatinolyticus]|uniref:hypothetical protein n=1 Tax=Glutamicibacter creatinolyticus TaxID=162496 RepID=UPI0031D0AC25